MTASQILINFTVNKNKTFFVDNYQRKQTYQTWCLGNAVWCP